MEPTTKNEFLFLEFNYFFLQAQAGAEGAQSTDSSDNGDDVVDGEFTEK